MIKLCILGNSHTASLKLGWDIIAHQYPDINITFFANRGVTMEALQVKEGILVPSNEELKTAIAYTSEGLTSINMQQFDACLLYGLDLKPYFAPNSFFSKSLLKETMLSHVSPSISWGLLHKIRIISDKTVFFGHTPLNAATNDTIEQGDTSAYQAGIKLMNQTVFSQYNASVIEQPLDTIVNGSQTMLKYSVGSTRLDIGDDMSNELHDIQDKMHMNGEFGASYLNIFLPRFTRKLSSFREGNG